MIAEKSAFFDNLYHFRRHHTLPAAVSRLGFNQRVGRKKSQIRRTIIGDLLDVMIVDQISKERAKITCDLICCADNLARRGAKATFRTKVLKGESERVRMTENTGTRQLAFGTSQSK
jgi:hypothetical protein